MINLYQLVDGLSQKKRALLALKLKEQAATPPATAAGVSDTKRLVAYVVPHSEQVLSSDELRRFVQEQVPDYMVPADFVVLAALPLTPGGKVDRQALPTPHPDRDGLAKEIAAPRTLVEEQMVRIWREVLGLEELSIYDNFFELGGHSLLATQVISRVEHIFKVKPPLSALFQFQTLEEFAAQIDSLQSAGQRLNPIAKAAAPSTPGQGIELSFAQQRLWFLNQLQPDNPFYNIPGALRLHGKLDLRVLRQALQEITRRHEVLRTTFYSVDGRPLQTVSSEARVPFSVIDLTELADGERELQAVRLQKEEAVRPFNLSHDSLLRSTVLKLGEKDFVLLISMHHIISDGWSIGVLIHELVVLYEAFLHGRPSPLPPLKFQYTDFSLWQRAWLRGEVIDPEIAYWKKQLAGMSALELPTDRVRPPVQSHRGARHSIAFPPDLTHKLRAFCRREDVTLFMMLLAGFAVLLHRYTGSEDISVGSPIANRNRIEVEDLIGFFVNMLVLRTDLSGDPTFRRLLRRVRETSLDAYAHQDLPFEKLIEELQPERDLSTHPLFQVTFALQNAPLPELKLSGLAVESVDFHAAVTRFDIEVHIEEAGDSLGGYILYSTDLFEPETIRRMAEQYEILLTGITENPDTRISALSLLQPQPPGEPQIAADSTDALPPYSPHTSLHELFERQVELSPDTVALVLGDESLSYRELNARANQIAHYLLDNGLRREQCVAILADRSFEMVVTAIGVLKAGGAYVPLDPSYPVDRLARMTKSSAAVILLAQQKWAHLLAYQDIPVTSIDLGQWAQFDLKSAENPDAKVQPDNLAYVIYTSGSTGEPKGVMVSHRSVCHHLGWRQTTYPLTADDRFLQKASFSFDISVWEIFGPLTAGARLILARPEGQKDPEYLANLVAAEGVTVMHFGPAMLQAFLDTPGLKKCTTLQHVFCGGEPLTVELQHQFFSRLDARLHNQYGPTEATIDVAFWDCDPNDAHPTVPFGYSNPHAGLYILDANLRSVPTGVIGELYIGGVALARGYIGRPDLSAERFIPNPLSMVPGGRLYRTGDMVRRRNDGALEFVTRIDRQVKIRGYRIELAEIEAVLREHPEVREASVEVKTSSAGDKHLVAYVASGCALDESGASGEPSGFIEQQVSQWRMVFDEMHTHASHDDGQFNVAGWNSSYTGEPIPQAEMREWVERTVERIGSLGAQNILEIGCGTGLLLFRLAPQCRSYLGTDFSPATIDMLRQEIEAKPERLRNVTLSCRMADDFSNIEPGTFDCVVINSVIQYFPGDDYLGRVLEGAVECVGARGVIFIGDVRNLALSEAFHSSVELARNSDAAIGGAELAERVRQRVEREEELLVDPRFFTKFKESRPEISGVKILTKRGLYHNELTQFRYDVVLYIDRSPAESAAPTPAIDLTLLDWCQHNLSYEALCQALETCNTGALYVRGVPDARVARAVALADMLSKDELPETTREIINALNVMEDAGVDPESIWGLSNRHPFSVEIMLPADGSAGRYEVIFTRAALASKAPWVTLPALVAAETHLPPQLPLSAFTNNPLKAKLALTASRDFVPKLRTFLGQKLPDHMVPAAFVMLDHLPRTPSGKIDRRALPAPIATATNRDSSFIHPRTYVEELLVGIWAEVLGLEQVSAGDNFFDLGGHSLLATQVVSRVRSTFDIEMPLMAIFEHPSVAALAQHIEESINSTATLSGQKITGGAQALKSYADGSRAFPLSFAQQRLWFLHRLEPRNTAYNTTAAVHLTGALDIEVLERSFNEVLRRHESLRTSFAVIDSKPAQVIHPPMTLEFRVENIDKEDADSLLSEIQRRTGEEAKRVFFNLEQAPLLQVKLLRLSPSEHVLMLSMHHIITDGWSFGVLVRELTALYEAFSKGAPSPLAELPIQYADYAVWQREQMQGAAFIAQLAYWKERLAGAPLLLAMPTDRPRTTVMVNRGGMQSLGIPKALSESLKELSRRQGVTLFMMLSAAFKTLLYRYTAQPDIIIGTPIANRNREETEGLLGFFANTLALRTDLSGDPDFQELLKRVRKTTLEAYEHQDLPFEKLVEELQPERSLSHTPLFQVMFVLQNAPAPPLELSGLRLRLLENLNVPSAKFDLTLNMADAPEGLSGTLEYNADLFDPATVARFRMHFETLLQSVVANPTERVSRLQLLTASEREQLVAAWNKTAAEFPKDQCIQTLFERQVERTPYHIALEFEGRDLSYLELNKRANQLAHHLRGLGVGPDVTVGICVEPSVEMVVGVLGVLKAGGAYVPLDLRHPHERLSFIMSDAGIRVLLTQQHLLNRLPKPEAKIICVDSDRDSLFGESEEDPIINATPDDLAYVIYTSGSTGKPKAVAMPHRPLMNLITWQLDRSSRVETMPRTLQFAPLSFDVSFQEIFSTLCAGATLILIGETVHSDARELLRALVDRRVERLFHPFVALQRLADVAAAEKMLPVHLREVITAGEQLKITRNIRNLFSGLSSCALDNQYGPSESHVVSAFMLKGLAGEWPELPAIGRPIANTQLYVLDNQLQPVPAGIVGEIYIAGEGLARGYLNRPGLTAERFLPDPFAARPGSRLYRTGDMARHIPSGEIEFLGRSDHQVKVRGFRVELGEVEAALGSHPAVRETVVVAREDLPGEKRLVAYVVSVPGQSPTPEELRRYLNQKLPQYMIPAFFIPLDKLPLTLTGKVDQSALPVPARQTSATLHNSYVAPRTMTEELLARMWVSLLGVDQVGVNDNFFELGGHSLMATQLDLSIQETFGIQIQLRTIFEVPTIAGLASFIEQVRAEQKAVGPESLTERLPPGTEEQPLLKLDELSDAQVDSLLKGLLGERDLSDG